MFCTEFKSPLWHETYKISNNNGLNFSNVKHDKNTFICMTNDMHLHTHWTVHDAILFHISKEVLFHSIYIYVHIPVESSSWMASQSSSMSTSEAAPSVLDFVPLSVRRLNKSFSICLTSAKLAINSSLKLSFPCAVFLIIAAIVLKFFRMCSMSADMVDLQIATVLRVRFKIDIILSSQFR